MVAMKFTDKLQTKLRDEGGIRALLGMVRCRHPDVLAQVARGIANFAKCESRASTQGISCLSLSHSSEQLQKLNSAIYNYN